MESVLLRPHKSTGDILELWNFLSGSRKRQLTPTHKRGLKELEEEAERRKPLLVAQQKQQQHWASCRLREQAQEEPGKLFKDAQGKWFASRQRTPERSLEGPSESRHTCSKALDCNWSEPPIMASASCIRLPQSPATGGGGGGGGRRSRRAARRTTKVAPLLAARRRLASSTPMLTQAVISGASWPSWSQVNGDSGRQGERIEAQRLSEPGDTHSNRLADSAGGAPGELPGACGGLQQRHTPVHLEGLLAAPPNQSHWPAQVSKLHGSFMPQLPHQATSGGGLECWHPSHAAAAAAAAAAAPSDSDNDNANSDDHRYQRPEAHSQTSQRLLPEPTLGLHNESPLTNDNGIDFEQQAAARASGCGADHGTEQAPRTSDATLTAGPDSAVPGPSSATAAAAATTTTTTTTQHQQQQLKQQPPDLSHQQESPRDSLHYPGGPQRPSSAHKLPSNSHLSTTTCSTRCEPPPKQLDEDGNKLNTDKLDDKCNQVDAGQQMGSETLARDKGAEILLRPLQGSGGSWLQALQSARHSGSYHVVQAVRNQLRAGSVSGASGHKQEVEAASANTASPQQAGERQVVQQISRSGRSPVSLQRQTNARLARHMFRLQQRQLLHQQQQQQQELISAPQCHREQQVQINSAASGAGYRSEGRQKQQPYPSLDRLSFTYSKSARQSRGSRAVRAYETWATGRKSNTGRNPIDDDISTRPDEYSTGQPSARNQKLQVIHQTTNNAARAIEICDNQLACSSRQINQTAFLTPVNSSFPHNQNQAGARTSHRQPTPSHRQVNVVVYKSVNMLRNVAPDCVNPTSSSSSKEFPTPLGHSEDNGSIDSATGSTLSLNKPFCKICHMSSAKNGDKLISPCKCSGTMQYIHCGCLLKWLEISNRTNEKPICCELCSHEYSWHKKFNYKRMQFPSCSLKDFFLHLFFFLALGLMLGCVISPIIQRRCAAAHDVTKLSGPQQEAVQGSRLADSLGGQQTQEGGAIDRAMGGRGKKGNQAIYAPHLYHSGARPGHLASGHLAQEEKLMLICAAVFFISFFSAIYSQTIARDSVYGLFVKFLNMNRTYYITEYDHGQLNNNNTCSGNKQQHQHQHQQQQQLTDGRSWLDRKFSTEEH